MTRCGHRQDRNPAAQQSDCADIADRRSDRLLEIACRVLERRVVPARASAPRVSCTVGEQMWRDR